MVSRKLHPGETLLKGRRKRIRTWAAIGGAEVERRPVPARRERDKVIPLGFGGRLPHRAGRQDRIHQVLCLSGDVGFHGGGDRGFWGWGRSPNDGRRSVSVGACVLLLTESIVDAVQRPGKCSTRKALPSVHLALHMGLEETEDRRRHARDLDARYEQRAPCIASQALQPTQAPVGAGGTRRTGRWRQARRQGSHRHRLLAPMGHPRAAQLASRHIIPLDGRLGSHRTGMQRPPR